MLHTQSIKVPPSYFFHVEIVYYIGFFVAPFLTISRQKLCGTLHKVIEYLVRRVGSSHKYQYDESRCTSIPEKKVVRINSATRFLNVIGRLRP
jgi:hypothetical protein